MGKMRVSEREKQINNVGWYVGRVGVWRVEKMGVSERKKAHTFFRSLSSHL